MENIENSFELKRKYFDNGHTKDYGFRIEQLRKLKEMIKKNEKAITTALYKDLHKPAFEAFTSEIGILFEEINFAIKHLKKWMKPKRVSTPISIAPSVSRIYPEPLGVVLIIGPWNYPFQLILAPLIGAISAGNCAILKPSDQSRNVSDVIARIISQTFEEQYISVVQGPGAMLGPMLIERFRFDHIFFTGSASVGRKISEMAAKTLTPVTLELGGKSPAIVDKDANIDISAKRLVWAKFFNAGQTCVCPDYLLVHECIKDEFVKRMEHYIEEFFGKEPENSESFGRIINDKRFDILCTYLEDVHIITGGRINKTTRYIEPTLIDEVSPSSKLMSEEIFGPILPIATFKTREENVETVRNNRYPLALYLFTGSRQTERFYINNIEFGGGCINNGIIHLVNSRVPFSGVGYSGMGRYHGKYSFETFTHFKSVVSTKTFFDPSIRYAPYSNKKLKFAKWLFK